MISIPIISEFNAKGINRAQKEFKQLETVGQKAQFAIKKAALPATLALGALAAGAKKAIDAGEAVGTANARIEQINKSMNLFGSQTDKVTQRLIKLAETTAMNTGMDNLSIKATQAKLLTFEELAKTAEKAGGAFDNAVQLGKALNDPIKGVTALTKSGVTFTAQEKEKIKVLVESNKMLEAQELVLKAIEKQVGGTAEATANDTDKMREGFAQFTQSLGLALLPVLEIVTPLLLQMASWAKDNPGVFMAIAAAVGALSVSILAVNAAMLLNPAVAITAGMIALGVAVVAAYKKFEGFREVVRTVVNAIAGYFEFMINGWIKAINLIIYGINLLKPGKDIKNLQEITIGRMSEPVAPSDPGVNGSANIAERNMNATINVYGGDPNQVVAALRTYMQRNGSVPIRVTN